MIGRNMFPKSRRAEIAVEIAVRKLPVAVDVAAIVHQDLNDLLVPFNRSSLGIIAV
jgi:hypothetical protein